jgi:uncharacterized repeat protein (TIGR03803 family)
MRPMRFSLDLTVTLAIFAVILFVARAWAAPKETVLHSFSGGKDGSQPYAGLISDAAGNLYGTTAFGGYPGHVGDGTVFELVPLSDGGWTETVLYSFKHSDVDGHGPYAGLTLDTAGNLFGTTVAGGGSISSRGAAFELTPQTRGVWAETILYSFTGKYGRDPQAGLILDASGNLYGTTAAGGVYGQGAVFELTPHAGGWSPRVLHSFAKDGNQGKGPSASLIFDAAGNLYGTTSGGGDGYGAVFELKREEGAPWAEKVLHSFNGKNGKYPEASLILDGAGNLYGTTEQGGNLSECGGFGCGVVFELSPNSGGGWTEKILHNFTGGKDGASSLGGLVFDASGNLYGTAARGGDLSCGYQGAGCGVVFKLVPRSYGGWAEDVLYSFKGGNDGAAPAAGLILDAAGNLYGTTVVGGTSDLGTVFKIVP